jgi:hypothetical protein
MIYIFDIDGTLCDISHRLHFITDKPVDWGAFYAACDGDNPIWAVITVARALYAAKQRVYITTGRSDAVRVQTVDWLNKYRVLHHGLYMRKEGDHREDSVVKSEMLDQILAKKLGEIGGVFEDRQQVVDMFRARGLRVLQVAKGDF